MLRGFDEEILSHRERRAERQFLVHHADAPLLGGRCIVSEETIFVAVEQQATKRWRRHTAEDAHERRFARAITSDEADHVRRGNREVDVRVRERGAVGFGDAQQFDDRSRMLSVLRFARHGRRHAAV